jgi:1-deoxy-D-xylulose-5-phosphate reductoisomerase
VAVEAFLAGRMKFTAIWQTVERVMQAHDIVAHPMLDQLVEADAWARRAAINYLV